MTKTNKKTRRSTKASKKRSRRYKGGAEYYAPDGDPDRDSVDIGMENALAKLGISNTPEGGEQKGWLAVSIAGILAIGGIGYLVLKKK